jgi:hypothetical protein
MALFTGSTYNKDVERTTGFFNSWAGANFLLNRWGAQYRNARVFRTFNPFELIPLDLSVGFAGFNLDLGGMLKGAISGLLDKKMNAPPDVTYETTVLKDISELRSKFTSPAFFLKQAKTNALYNMVPYASHWKGGAAFQVAGLNLVGIGLIDFTNVTPRTPQSPLDIFSQLKNFRTVTGTSTEGQGVAGGYGHLADSIDSKTLQYESTDKFTDPSLYKSKVQLESYRHIPDDNIKNPIARYVIGTKVKYTDQEVGYYPLKSKKYPLSYPDRITKGSDDHTIRFPSKKLDSKVEDETYGMPFYFKDLRDNTFLVFRGFVTGLTENLSPTWNSENYLGRSEPVYVYERAERDIAFTLKLFALSKFQLSTIYRKLNKLSSLCYPEYKQDSNLDNKVRMKPPLTDFRLGELYGKSETTSLQGFIKSITYTFPDEGPWETKKGERVPKLIEASIGYQVIHSKVPDKSFGDVSAVQADRFFGYKG